VKRPSKKWRKMADIYKRFAPEGTDLSEDAACAMYAAETFGEAVDARNGYAQGKKWMDATIEMWKEDIPKGLLFVRELQSDDYPDWFLKRVGILDAG